MKFRVERDVLAESVAWAARSLPSRPSVPILAGLLVEAEDGQITLSGRSLQEAQDLALTLKAGALPIPLKIVEERQVGATLGEDAIHDGLIAGLAGTALVILIMVGYYRLAGVIAVCVALGVIAIAATYSR